MLQRQLLSGHYESLDSFHSDMLKVFLCAEVSFTEGSWTHMMFDVAPVMSFWAVWVIPQTDHQTIFTFFYFCTSRVFPCNVTIEQNPEFITETAPLEQPEVQCLARGHKWLCLMSRFFRRSNLSEPNHNICLSKIEFRKALLIFYALVMFSILSEILRLWVAGGS